MQPDLIEDVGVLQVPSSIEAEQMVIGGVLVNNAAFDECVQLRPEMFFHIGHQVVWQAICDMVAANIGVDVVTLDDFLRQREGDQSMDMGYFIDLYNNTASAHAIKRHVQIVLDRYAERQMLLASGKIRDLAIEREGRSVSDRQAEAVSLLTEIANQAAQINEERTYIEALREGIRYKQELFDSGRRGLIGFDTGLPKLNEYTNGLRRGDLTVIGGRPSMGKSVLAENIARCCARNGLKVRFQSYEMNSTDLTDRGASAQFGIDYGHLRTAVMSREEWDHYNDYVNLSAGWSFLIDTEMVGVERLAARCRAMKRKQGLDLLVVDHLHLMPRPNKNTVQELDEITARLKRLAMELDIHVLLVAQLSRAVNGRPDKRPQMSDLRESGGIEQNANIIIFPYRPGYYDESVNQNEAELILAKNRDGERGSVIVGWQGQYQRFVNQPDPWEPPAQAEQEAKDDPFNV